jgi:hypothetical protein
MFVAVEIQLGLARRCCWWLLPTLELNQFRILDVHGALWALQTGEQFPSTYILAMFLSSAEVRMST